MRYLLDNVEKLSASSFADFRIFDNNNHWDIILINLITVNLITVNLITVKYMSVTS